MPKIKNKYLLLQIFLIIFIFWGSIASGAQTTKSLEVTSYPNIPGLTTPTADCSGGNCLPIFASYWIGLLIYIAGILALISFTIGAVQYLISIDNKTMASDAKDRMKGSVFGLILTICSILILRTINPVFISPSLTPLPGVQGVYYYNGNQKEPVASQVSDTSTEQAIKDGYTSIIYDCTPGSTNQPALLIWEFPQAGLETDNWDLKSVHVAIKTCGQIEPISGYGSFKMSFETPGVYYYLQSGCSGYMSGPITSSESYISAPFAGNIKSVRIFNDQANSYGVIFHNTAGLGNGGECTFPLTNEGCQAVNISDPEADNVFVLNQTSGSNSGSTANSSGNGVYFYSRPTGWNSNNGKVLAGYYSVPKEKIESTVFLPMDEMCFDYTNADVPDSYKFRCTDSTCGGTNYGCGSDSDCYNGETCDPDTNTCVDQNTGGYLCSDSACETFQDCPGSIQIKGQYLVGLYSQDSTGATYCETFTNDVPNLDVQDIVASGTYLDSEKNDAVYVIPTK